MTLASDETQPKSPFKQKTQDAPAPFLVPEPEDTGPGCLMWGVVGLIILIIGLAIVGLSAAAGWNTGQRTAQSNATTTQDALIANQVNKIATEVAQGNTALVQYRIDALAASSPGNAQVAMLMQTGTALYFDVQPTITPTPTVTLTPTETPVVEEEPAETQEQEVVVTPEADGGFDPADLLSEARELIRQDELDEAIELLDVIITIDPNFEKTTVTQLMLDTLSTRAVQLFRSGDDTQLARAIRLTDRAENFGTLPPDLGLGVEREVANLYLNAKATIGTSDFTTGLTYLQEIRVLAPNWRSGEIQQMLVTQYTSLGDSQVALGQPCSAVGYYDSLLALVNDSTVTAKRDAAQIACQLGATPTPVDPFAPTPEPIGQ